MPRPALVYALVVTLLLGGAYAAKQKWDAMQAEIRGLREYRDSVQEQQRVSAATSVAFAKGLKEGKAQAAHVDRLLTLHDKATQEARHEDPDVDAWLRAPIPDRLRRADAAARESDRLDEGRARDQ